MSEWTKQRVEQMIADGVEESLSLDYKRADALAKTDGKKTEITKDVSAFANSSGGVLIYGVAEFADDARKHLPERLDPISRTEISKEWLDQVIQSIQPRIEGVIVHPIEISMQDNTVCYVVEVPQSHTAHMARDHRYHKRHNFTTQAMEDYEVRDVMNRRTHPRIHGYVYANRRFNISQPHGLVTVRLENVGNVLAKHVMVEMEVPREMNGGIAIEGPVWMKRVPEGTCQHFRLFSPEGPLFPNSDVHLRRAFRTGVDWTQQSGSSEESALTHHLKIAIFADEMPPIRATLDIAPVLQGMTPILNPGTSPKNSGA